MLPPETPNQTPVNPNATPEARELLRSLYAISGKNYLTGQHNAPQHISKYSDLANEITGRYPAVWGQDFGFSAPDTWDGINFRQPIIDEAKRQYAAGAIITLMWHAVRPIEDEPVNFQDNVSGKITEENWRDLITPGTEIHTRWQAQSDVIAGFLTQLRDAKIPVLWRPYHEMNGGWFWWGKRGGPEGYAALWKQLYNRFVNVHHLDNLLWVWNANAPASHLLPYADCYPGADCVDVLATDIYRADYKQSHYDDLVTLAAGKPVALGEIGEVPPPALWDTQPRWAWFMVWNTFLTDNNTPEAINALYHDPHAINRPVTVKNKSANTIS